MATIEIKLSKQRTMDGVIYSVEVRKDGILEGIRSFTSEREAQDCYDGIVTDKTLYQREEIASTTFDV
jgi:hypothetical protein